MKEYVIAIANITDDKYIIPHKNKAKVLSLKLSSLDETEPAKVSVMEEGDISFILLSGVDADTIRTALSSFKKDDILVLKGEKKTSSKGKNYIYVNIKNTDIIPMDSITLEDYNKISEYLLSDSFERFEDTIKRFYFVDILKDALKTIKNKEKEEIGEDIIKDNGEEKKEEKDKEIAESINTIKSDKDAVREEIARVREELLKGTTKTRNSLIGLALSNLIAGDNVFGVLGGTGIGKTDTILKTISAFYNQDEIMYITCGPFTKLENLGIYPDIKRMKEEGKVFYNKDVFLKKKVALFDELPNITGEGGKVLSAIISLFTPQREITVDTERTKSNLQAIFWTGNFAPDLEEEEAKYGTLQIFDRTNLIYQVQEPDKSEIYEILLKNLDGVNYETKKLSDEEVILKAREMAKDVSISKAIVDDLANFIVELSHKVSSVYRPSPRKIAGIIGISKILSFLNKRDTVDPKIVFILLRDATLHPFVRDNFNQIALRNIVSMAMLEDGKAKKDEIDYLENVANLLEDDILKERLKTKLKK